MLLIYILLVIILILLLYIYRLVGASRRSIEALQQQLDSIQPEIDNANKRNQANEDAIQELRVGTLGMGQKLKELTALLKLTRDKQEELSNLDPDNRLYTKANKLIEAGASIEELMLECELPRAEAELLLSLRKK